VRFFKKFVRCGLFGINDEATLGRETEHVPDPLKPGEFLKSEDLEAKPFPVQALLDESFHAVKIAAGDSISAAIARGVICEYGDPSK